MNERRAVANAIEALLAAELSYETYAERVPEDPEDELVAEVLDLVEHLPKKGGVFGVSEHEHAAYVARIRVLVEHLRARR